MYKSRPVLSNYPCLPHVSKSKSGIIITLPPPVTSPATKFHVVLHFSIAVSEIPTFDPPKLTEISTLSLVIPFNVMFMGFLEKGPRQIKGSKKYPIARADPQSW